MTLITEGRYTGDFLAFEASGTRSRDEITLLEGENLDVGAVLGKITAGAASAVAGGSNTGDGAMGAITLGANAIPGAYVLKIVAAASDAGTFHLFDPQGDLVGEGTVGVAFASTHLSFTLADGAADFAAGDTFTITVALGSAKYVEYDPTATNGAQLAAGILWSATDATDADTPCVAIVRDAEVKADLLTWPTGFTDGQKAAGIAQLEARGVIARAGY